MPNIYILWNNFYPQEGLDIISKNKSYSIENYTIIICKKQWIVLEISHLGVV
jgi:hypothetical protein